MPSIHNTFRTAAGWRNWSASARCLPTAVVSPTTEKEITDAVGTAARHGESVRVAGTGHSFNSLACTDGTLLDITRYRGVVRIDKDAQTVTVRAGTPITELNAALDRAGLAMECVGTLGEQTVGGAVATGNHGTGITHAPFSSQVTALTFVAADGKTHHCDRNSDPELFGVLRTSLGALGVVSEITLRCVPRFRLRVTKASLPLERFLGEFDAWARSSDHVSMNWSPWTDSVTTTALSRTSEQPTRHAHLRGYATTLDEVRCGVLGLVGNAVPSSIPALSVASSGVLARLTGATESYVDASHRVFSFPQPVRFLALEHALPLDRTEPALRALRGVLRRSGMYSPYSVLIRVGAADDSPLSPAYGRETGYLNVTVPRAHGYAEILRLTEQVLRDFGARPHWGKAHTATAEILRSRYPEWSTFQRVRCQWDPNGLFSNDYLNRVLGPVVGAPSTELATPFGEGTTS